MRDVSGTASWHAPRGAQRPRSSGRAHFSTCQREKSATWAVSPWQRQSLAHTPSALTSNATFQLAHTLQNSRAPVPTDRRRKARAESGAAEPQDRQSSVPQPEPEATALHLTMLGRSCAVQRPPQAIRHANQPGGFATGGCYCCHIAGSHVFRTRPPTVLAATGTHPAQGAGKG